MTPNLKWVHADFVPCRPALSRRRTPVKHQDALLPDPGLRHTQEEPGGPDEVFGTHKGQVALSTASTIHVGGIANSDTNLRSHLRPV